MTHDFPRILSRTALIAAAVLPLAACGEGGQPNFSRGVQSVHQPVVSYATFLYDVRIDGGPGLSLAEKDRLGGWLDSLNVAYGDKIAIASSGAAIPTAVQDDITAILGQRGMMIGTDASAMAGTPPAGSVRLILRRASASVPGCPDWTTKQESDMVGGTSSNFGCAVNGNLAAMVANPEDLVRGESTDSDLRTATSNRAIQTYREKAPTGAGGLQSISAGGN